MAVGLAELIIVCLIVDWATAPLGAWAIALVGERVLEEGVPGEDESRTAALESMPHGEDLI